MKLIWPKPPETCHRRILKPTRMEIISYPTARQQQRLGDQPSAGNRKLLFTVARAVFLPDTPSPSTSTWKKQQRGRGGRGLAGDGMDKRGPNRCEDAVAVVVNRTRDGLEWFTSTAQLQLVSLQLCAVCRSMRSLQLTVAEGTPVRLWNDDSRTTRQAKKNGFTRVPVFNPRRLIWELSPSGMNSGYFLLGKVDCLILGDNVDGCVDCVMWPRVLEKLVFGRKFDHSVMRVSWPSTLRELTFGFKFNQALPVNKKAWSSLQQLTLGWCFNQPITDVGWPSSLLQLDFIGHFNQPINNVCWPDSLEQLSFGWHFNQPLYGVAWPSSLLRLTFGYVFNQPIARVKWPASLLQLTFGNCFDQSIDMALWPQSLEQLTFGWHFNHPIHRTFWPESLQELTFGAVFNWPIDRVVWPSCLRQVTFGELFNQRVTKIEWPPSLQQIYSYTNCGTLPVGIGT